VEIVRGGTDLKKTKKKEEEEQPVLRSDGEVCKI
jgi:hypothetical protein